MMTKYKIIYNDGPANELFYSFLSAKTNMEVLLRIFWTLSEDGELEDLSEWLEENNKNITIKQIADLDNLSDESIVKYIKDFIHKLSIETGVYIRQIINTETNEFVYDIDNIKYCRDFIMTDEEDFYNTIEHQL